MAGLGLKKVIREGKKKKKATLGGNYGAEQYRNERGVIDASKYEKAGFKSGPNTSKSLNPSKPNTSKSLNPSKPNTGGFPKNLKEVDGGTVDLNDFASKPSKPLDNRGLSHAEREERFNKAMEGLFKSSGLKKKKKMPKKNSPTEEKYKNKTIDYRTQR